MYSQIKEKPIFNAVQFLYKNAAIKMINRNKKYGVSVCMLFRFRWAKEQMNLMHTHTNKYTNCGVYRERVLTKSKFN